MNRKQNHHAASSSGLRNYEAQTPEALSQANKTADHIDFDIAPEPLFEYIYSHSQDLVKNYLPKFLFYPNRCVKTPFGRA